MAMQAGKIKKTYLAILWGTPTEKSFSLDAPIIRQGEVEPTKIHLKRMIHPSGASAKTHFRVLRSFATESGDFSLVEAQPLTGRTHQIRLHASHAGYPVVGDKIYGPSEDCYLEFIQTGWTPSLEAKLLMNRHALHSSGLGIEWKGKWLEWQIECPQDMKSFESDS
jgi:23S rRNA pseudouridine1911/1915/1917 synthase